MQPDVSLGNFSFVNETKFWIKKKNGKGKEKRF